jgi:RPA family protein
MAGMAGFSREVAKRIFAEELKSSNYSFRDGEDQHQYAPSYLLTPTGAKCNRVFVVGILTEKDDIGGDTEYWRGRVVDPTGSILIYAGQYQPEAAQILACMEAPSYVAVVGKPNLYQTDDGNIIISLRAESIQRVDENTRNQWIIDTARRTSERLVALKNARPLPESTDFATADSVPATSSSSTPEQDADRALQHYHTDIEHFRQMVLRALTSLRADLVKNDTPLETTAAKSAMAEVGKKAATMPAAPEEAPSPRKNKPKKSETFNAWPAPEDEEEVETINIGKKS